MKTVKLGSVGLGRLGYEHAKNLATLLPGVPFTPSATWMRTGFGLWRRN